MATARIDRRVTEMQSVSYIDHVKDSEIPGWELALNRLTGELVAAFFIAMAVMWVVTMIAGIFA
jgi:hypothetical protein